MLMWPVRKKFTNLKYLRWGWQLDNWGVYKWLMCFMLACDNYELSCVMHVWVFETTPPKRKEINIPSPPMSSSLTNSPLKINSPNQEKNWIYYCFKWDKSYISILVSNYYFFHLTYKYNFLEQDVQSSQGQSTTRGVRLKKYHIVGKNWGLHY